MLSKQNPDTTYPTIFVWEPALELTDREIDRKCRQVAAEGCAVHRIFSRSVERSGRAASFWICCEELRGELELLLDA